MTSYVEGKQEENLQHKKGQTKVDAFQIGLRAAAFASSLAAACVTFTSKQTTVVFGIQVEAKYSYSATFKFFAAANVIASVCSLLSLGFTFILPRIPSTKANNHLFFFLHDLVMMSLLLSGCSGASALGYIGQHGYEQAGWMPICDHFSSFCHKSTAAVSCGYLSFVLFFILTIINATKSTPTPQSPLHLPTEL